MDAMAREGILLDRHYVFKFCSPTRSSILSGRLPIHVNQENSATEQPNAGVRRCTGTALFRGGVVSTRPRKGEIPDKTPAAAVE